MAVRSNATLKHKDDHKGLRLDTSDIENIRNALNIYEKMNPRGKYRYMNDIDPINQKPKRYIEYLNINDHLDFVRKQVKQERKLKHVIEKKNEAPINLKLSIPPSLEAWLNKGYPKLFTDSVQTDQFLRAFPQFDLSK